MDQRQRQALIECYRQGPQAVSAALEGMSDAELDAHPIEGEWSVREIVHHLADSEMTSAIRIRRLLAEERPAIAGYDEAEFARRLHYRSRPIGPSLQALRAARTTSADILDRIEASDWERQGTHNEIGAYGVENWLEVYATHAHDHADQIRRVRAAIRT